MIFHFIFFNLMKCIWKCWTQYVKTRGRQRLDNVLNKLMHIAFCGIELTYLHIGRYCTYMYCYYLQLKWIWLENDSGTAAPSTDDNNDDDDMVLTTTVVVVVVVVVVMMIMMMMMMMINDKYLSDVNNFYNLDYKLISTALRDLSLI